MYSVYVVLLGTEKPEIIKPGISKNPKERIRSYQTTHAMVKINYLENGFTSKKEAEKRAKSIEYMLKKYKIGKPKNEIFKYNDESALIINKLVTNQGEIIVDKFELAKQVSGTFNIPLQEFYELAEKHAGKLYDNKKIVNETINNTSSKIINTDTIDFVKLIDKALKNIPKGNSFTNEDIYKSVGVYGVRTKTNGVETNNKIRREQEHVREILQNDFKNRHKPVQGKDGRCRQYVKK